MASNLSTEALDMVDDPSQIVLISDINNGQEKSAKMGPKSKNANNITSVKGQNNLVRQNSETEYLIDPESSVGMLILKPTHQYSSNVTTSAHISKPNSPMQIYDYQAVKDAEDGQKNNVAFSGFYQSSSHLKKKTIAQSANTSSLAIPQVDAEMTVICN